MAVLRNNSDSTQSELGKLDRRGDRSRVTDTQSDSHAQSDARVNGLEQHPHRLPECPAGTIPARPSVS